MFKIQFQKDLFSRKNYDSIIQDFWLVIGYGIGIIIKKLKLFKFSKIRIC